MEIFVDRADKTYEPGEKLTGYVNTAFPWADSSGFSIKAECYMDTVSIIRGNVGRGPLEEKDRIYFMKKVPDIKDITAPKAPVNAVITTPKAGRSFEFVLEATETSETLIDTYTGVDFSVLYKITASCRLKSGKVVTAEFAFIVKCPGAGVNIEMGRKTIEHDFVISHENLETKTTTG